MVQKVLQSVRPCRNKYVSIYNPLGHGRVDQADFRMDLAMWIINHYVQQREPYSTRGRPSIRSSPTRFAGRTSHPVREIPGKKYQWCFLCYQPAREKMTRSTCRHVKSLYAPTGALNDIIARADYEHKYDKIKL